MRARTFDLLSTCVSALLLSKTQANFLVARQDPRHQSVISWLKVVGFLALPARSLATGCRQIEHMQAVHDLLDATAMILHVHVEDVDEIGCNFPRLARSNKVMAFL